MIPDLPVDESSSQWFDIPPETGDSPPTPEEEFADDVSRILSGTGGTISAADLDLVPEEEWDSFLAGLLGFVSAPSGGSNQNSYYDDHSNEAPLGEYFVDYWGFLPSIQHMPGYHYYDYLTQNIDPEFMEWAYAAYSGASVFAESDLSLGDIENLPFQMIVDGRPITIVWHSGPAPASNFQTDPNDSNAVVVNASLGYFSVRADPLSPSTGSETPPTGLDLMQLNEDNAPYIRFLDQALRYLDDSPLAVQIMLAAFNAGVKIKIVTGASDSRFDIAHNVVEWNPGMALRLSNGGVMSPSMVLIHELAHGIVNLFGDDFQYDTVEERFIIEHYEQIIAAHLGEPIRENHRGTPVFGIGTVTYHVPAPPG